MEASPYTPAVRLERREELRRRALRRRVLGTVAAVVLLAGVLWGWSLRGEVAPGVAVAGVDVGGMDRASASALLNERLGERLREPITVRAGGRTVEVVPARLGIRIDLQRTVDAALAADRVRARLLPVGMATSLPAVVVPARDGLPAALRRLERPARDGKVAVARDARVFVEAARDGLRIPAEAAIQAIGRASLEGRSSVELAAERVAPGIPTAAAEEAGAAATRMLSGPVAVRGDGRLLGTLTPRDLAPLLLVRPGKAAIAVRLDARGIERALAPAVADVVRDPVDASWRTDGSRASVVPAAEGIRVDRVATARSVRAAALADGEGRVARVRFATRAPALTTAEARALGITNLVTSVTTDLGSSSANRVENVALMARILDNHVVMPGETFSFNEVVGPRSAERGFKEGYAIVDGLMLPSIGGGVCQVATTVYDAAFYGGYAIDSRTNHSFYIDHYAVGMDATVAENGPDLQWTNDTEHAVLIRTAASESTMTVNLYSTPRPGLEVEKVVGGRSPPVAPAERYILDPDLPRGAVERVTEGVPGFTVDVRRVVRLDGEVVKDSTFTSTYIPEDIVYRVGPDAPVPAGAVVEDAPEGF